MERSRLFRSRRYAEPKYVDGLHLRPAFVREQVHFLDFLLK